MQIFVLPITGLSIALYLIIGMLSDLAVLVFFVLSGFVISATVINSYANKTFIQDFSINKIVRIYPSYIFALSGKPLPIYGSGNQIRDWLYVDDHAQALILVAIKGMLGETYNIGGYNEKKNIEVVNMVCKILDELEPTKEPYNKLITFVADRAGHDVRYAIDASKITRNLGWMPKETFETGLQKTVEWYLESKEWSSKVVKNEN